MPATTLPTPTGWIPEGQDLTKPNAARIYDFVLGGYHNFDVDRVVAKRLMASYPNLEIAALANRAFLKRVVTFLVNQGIEQIIDIGSGIPTVQNTHEVAQAINPRVRVLYVDRDPVAIGHSKLILKDTPNALAIQADAADPDGIIHHQDVQALLDLSRPVGLLFVLLLHYLVDDEVAYHTVLTFRDQMAAGSYLAIAHPSIDLLHRVTGAFKEVTETKLRSKAEIEKFFDGFEILDPGIVPTPLWRPESPTDFLIDTPEQAINHSGVGRLSL